MWRFLFLVIPYKEIEGRLCYQIKVTPKEVTKRHFKGNVFARVDNLDVIFSEGSKAKSLWFKKDEHEVLF